MESMLGHVGEGGGTSGAMFGGNIGPFHAVRAVRSDVNTILFFVGWGVCVSNFVDGPGRLRLVASCCVATLTGPHRA